NFIPGELSKLDGRPAVAIALAGGETATLPLPQTPTSRPANGKVVLGVRPEHLFRYDPNLKAQKAGLARLTAPVELVEPTGAETHAVLKIGDKEIVGRFDPDGAPRLGADIVRAFARNAARVAFIDVQHEQGEAMAAAVKEAGGTALFLRCDVTDIPALQASIAEARAKLGPIAVLVNNAANDERHAVAD